jgi:nicotinamidase-related amidase
MPPLSKCLACGVLMALTAGAAPAEEPPGRRTYENRLKPLIKPGPLLADHPEFVEPIREAHRFEAPVLVDDKNADLSVRAWRFCYNARGIIEVPNHLRGRDTALIVVHPWGIDDGQGWTTPEPAGVAFACTPERNRIALDHMKRVLNPFLKSLRGKVGLVAYSLPGAEDPIRKKLYRSMHGKPSEEERRQGAQELAARLKGFTYRGQALPEKLTVSTDWPAVDYFRQLPGLDPGPKYNNAGFWDLPIPVARPLEVDPADVVIYDPEGYPALKAFLQKQGIRHVLLTGYHTDMCVCRTTAGYKNLAQDFDTFLVGDATQATFPASATPRFATTTAVAFASLDLFITQVSWVRYQPAASAGR